MLKVQVGELDLLLEAKKPVHVLPSGVAREDDDITLDVKLFNRGQRRMQDTARL